jgi:uncharacterized membrane protein YbhN (UPF0104 family)
MGSFGQHASETRRGMTTAVVPRSEDAAATSETSPERYDEDLPLGRLARRPLNLVLLFVFGVLLVVGIFLLFGKVAGYAETLEQLKRAEPVWLAVCFASQVFSYTAYVVLVRALTAYGDGPVLPRWLATRIVFVALGVTRLVAVGGAGGLGVLYWIYRQLNFSRGDAFARVIALNTLLYATFGAAALIAGATILGQFGGDAPLTMVFPWMIGVAAFFLVGIYVTSPARAARFTNPEDEGRVRRLVGYAVAGAVLARSLAEHRAPNRATLAGAPLYWFGDMLCLWAGLRAFGVELTPAELVLAYATGFLANLLPIPTGGIGGVDAATTFALTAIGVPLQSALLGVFTYRFFSYLLPTLPAILAVPTLPQVSRELSALAESQPPRRQSWAPPQPGAASSHPAQRTGAWDESRRGTRAADLTLTTEPAHAVGPGPGGRPVEGC